MKKIISIVLIVCLMAILLVGCGEVKDVVPTRFCIVDETKLDIGGNQYSYILVDTETNVLYLFYDGVGDASGVTVLLDADGKPLLWEGD